MSFQFRHATRESIWLLLSLAGGTGSGKSLSSMKLAAGMSGDSRFAVIDTENGRARHYADDFNFDVADLTPPFSPDAYLEAILAAEKARYGVIVVDAFSHEHAGEGGLLDWHESELQRMAGDDWKRRESCNMAAWIKPKMAHKSLVSRLLQVRAHLIFSFRAESKVEMAKGKSGKMEIRPKQTLTGLDGWVPICEKNFPYEMTASFLLTADAPGVPKPIKLQEQHRPFFPLDKPITEEAGRQLAEWAKGGKPKEKTTAPKQSHKKPAVEAVRKKIQAAQSAEDLQALIESEIAALADGEKAELREEFKNRMAEVMA